MEFVNGKDDIPSMKWKKCLKPPTSIKCMGEMTTDLSLNAWTNFHVTMEKNNMITNGFNTNQQINGIDEQPNKKNKKINL